MTDRPAIKSLDWQEIHQARSNEDPRTEVVGFEADAGFASHYTIEVVGGGFTVTDPEYETWSCVYPSEDAAKAAAQANFASHIRSCLLDKPEAVEVEPVAWIFEDDLPESYPYDIMFKFSKVDGVRLFPVYAPSPADTDAAQGAIERLVRALEPFAKIGDYMRYTPPARSVSVVYMAVEADGINSHGSAKETVAAFREARTALTAYRAEEPRT